MIHIVTGKINGGKTTTLYDLYHKHHQGDGFVSIKRMHYDKVHGYDLMRLSDGRFIPFVVHEAYQHSTDTYACQIGPYLFRKKALDMVDSHVKKWVVNGVYPIYLDEIGALELQEKGFHSTLQYCINQHVETYITVRGDLVDEVIQFYHLESVDIIHV